MNSTIFGKVTLRDMISQWHTQDHRLITNRTTTRNLTVAYFPNKKICKHHTNPIISQQQIPLIYNEVILRATQEISQCQCHEIFSWGIRGVHCCREWEHLNRYDHEALQPPSISSYYLHLHGAAGPLSSSHFGMVHWSPSSLHWPILVILAIDKILVSLTYEYFSWLLTCASN